jgi:hypothetical protein
MTKARDTANFISTGVPNSLITLDAAEIPNISTDKLTSGTLPDARIADLAATKLTGSIADARIPASAVTQHVTATDLSGVNADITALALREATNESSAAFNLPNKFIETFSDDTNLLTQTTVDRVSGYVASVYTSTTTLAVTTNLLNNSNTSASAVYTSSTGTAANCYDGDGDATGGSVGMSGIVGFPQNTVIDLGSGNGIILNEVGIFSYLDINGAYVGSFTFAGSNDGSSYTTLKSHSGVLSTYTAYAKYTFTNTTAYRYYKTTITDNAGGYANEIYLRDVAGYKTPGLDIPTSADNATGTLIQSANTVGSAKTVVGGTMIYKDNAGTATLGTDLKIYFSCNNGGAWTEAASYNAITPVYSTGIKQVRLGATTCTSGTGVIYKAVWANQAASSKETQLHGIGINY